MHHDRGGCAASMSRRIGLVPGRVPNRNRLANKITLAGDKEMAAEKGSVGALRREVHRVREIRIGTNAELLGEEFILAIEIADHIGFEEVVLLLINRLVYRSPPNRTF